MNQKLKIILSSLIFFIFLSSVSIALGEEIYEDSENVFLADGEVKSVPKNTPPTNPEFFKEISDSDKSLASFGVVPLKTGEDAHSWWMSLKGVTESVHEDQAFGNYLAVNGGPICGYSCNIYGFVSVYLDPEMNNQKTPEDLESMKSVLEKYAQDEGIEDLPIIFINGRLNVVLDSNDKYSLSESNNKYGYLSYIMMKIRGVF
ncbi:hypothetical protein [Methanolapillus millepedarum]|uniref:Uncharacterized protein n=1 Tax=Methanolapillus millepedarum TaxID=3028296 RepID=A0AA96V4Q9_9EURY|nr:hypothetical protein MsAc7_14650 [Methanosarcinaceae archaeon Ac7]